MNSKQPFLVVSDKTFSSAYEEQLKTEFLRAFRTFMLRRKRLKGRWDTEKTFYEETLSFAKRWDRENLTSFEKCVCFTEDGTGDLIAFNFEGKKLLEI